jgi:hypothetical protein
MLNMHRKISLRLDADLADRLQLRADRERVPVSYLLRHCVLRLLAGDSQEPSPSKPDRRKESPATLKTRAEQLQDEFRQLVCSTFDALTRQGCDSKEAVKRTNSALKERKHPWATHDVISHVLRQAGRFRKSGRV